MKTSISSDVWEKKKGLIAKLYMEEEWPLKQVIKQIRSDDFNPSETQLRSRLKKWRVTKPSRQTRKKPQGTDDGDSDKDVKGSSTSPRNNRPPPMKRDTSTTSPHWTGAYHSAYVPSDIPTADHQQMKWNTSLDQQVSPTPSGEHGLVAERPSVPNYNPSPTTSSFEQSAQASPINDGLVVNTSSELTPTYAGYPLSPDSCIPSPGSTAAMPWPARSVSVDLGLNSSLYPTQWYPMPFEPITPPSGVPHSASMAPPPGYRDHMPMVVPSNPSVYPHEYGSFPGEGMEYPNGYDPKHWKRTMSLQYDFTGHPSARPDQADRKHMAVHGHPPPGMVPMPAGQPGAHNGMCAPLVPYLGQNPMAHKQHRGVGY
ncbi:hypothetical protein N7456_005400 [Penicillium angulare]|uniref:Clr5 domain-containing protein n=1 Tax=Penicillium angulare TaxID=116970 RepID=A0A9W9FZA2_9EURO|nr:hypothetical protein N7456_005400 [Penicillium angulare]